MVDRIAGIVASMTRYYIASGRALSSHDINCGSCADFAEAVLSAISSLRPVPEACEVWVDDMLVGSPDDDERLGFDQERLALRYPEASPPAGLEWSDMDEISRRYGFAGGSHVWVCAGGRHYDAEAVEGVENPFDLPYFRRVFEHFHASEALAGEEVGRTVESPAP